MSFEFFAAMSEDSSCYYCGGPRSVCAGGEDSRHQFTMVLDDRYSSRGVFSSILAHIRTLFLLWWKYWLDDIYSFFAGCSL